MDSHAYGLITVMVESVFFRMGTAVIIVGAHQHEEYPRRNYYFIT